MGGLDLYRWRVFAVEISLRREETCLEGTQIKTKLGRIGQFTRWLGGAGTEKRFHSLGAAGRALDGVGEKIGKWRRTYMFIWADVCNGAGLKGSGGGGGGRQHTQREGRHFND